MYLKSFWIHSPLLLILSLFPCVQEADNCKWRFAKQCRGLILMADSWLIPCNAFIFQPPLHSHWLEKAAELICELMHMSAKHYFSAQSCGHCVLWPRRAGDMKGAAAGLGAAPLQPSSNGLVWPGESPHLWAPRL